MLPSPNRCIADHVLEYQYIHPFQWTQERAVILEYFKSNLQIRLQNQISQRLVLITIRRSGTWQIISDVLSEVQRTDPSSVCVYGESYCDQHWLHLQSAQEPERNTDGHRQSLCEQVSAHYLHTILKVL